MKVAFDTSVIVAGLVAAHPHHARSRRWLAAARAEEVHGLMSWHAVAEAWSVLTKLPLDPPISGDAARRLLDKTRAFVAAIEPSPAIYERAIDLCASRGFRSGAIFDALHLATAENQRADTLLTWNRYDFERLASADTPAIATPDEDAP